MVHTYVNADHADRATYAEVEKHFERNHADKTIALDR